MSFPFRYEVQHPAHGVEQFYRTKGQAREYACKRAKELGDKAQMIVHDKCAHHGRVEYWTVTYRTDPNGESWSWAEGSRRG